jgi:O-antigen/teichoic acid export membrane protein
MATRASAQPLLRAANYFLAGGLGGAFNVLLTVALLRLLGGAGYKTVGLALSASMFVGALTFEWLRFYTLRFGGEPWRLGPIYALYAISAVALTAAAGAMALFGVRPELEFFVILVALIAVAQAVCDVLIVVARGAGNLHMLFVMQAARGGLALLICGATAAATQSPQAVLISLVACNAAVSLLTLFVFRRSMPPAAAFSSYAALDVLRFGGPLTASAVINTLLLMSDRWIISFAGGFHDATVGGYIGLSDIAIRGLTFFAGVVVGAFLQDMLAAFDRHEVERAAAHYGLMTIVFTAIVAPIVVASTLLGADVGAVVLSRIEDQPSWMIFGAIVVAVATHITRNALIETLLLLEKRTMLALAINVGCLALAVALSVVLMPLWGMAGAPLAYTFACLAATTLSVALMRRETRALLSLKTAACVPAAAVFAGLICVFLAPAEAPAWIRLAAFALLYGAMLVPIGRESLRRGALGTTPARGGLNW